MNSSLVVEVLGSAISKLRVVMMVGMVVVMMFVVLVIIVVGLPAKGEVVGAEEGILEGLQ